MVSASDLAVDNRRHNPRIDFEAKIDFSSEHQFYTGLTSNLSEGGLFIATYNLLPLGKIIKFRFTLPDKPNPIEMLGEVCWHREYNETYPDFSPGMGIRFIDLTESIADRITKFLRRREPLFYDDF